MGHMEWVLLAGRSSSSGACDAIAPSLPPRNRAASDQARLLGRSYQASSCRCYVARGTAAAPVRLPHPVRDWCIPTSWPSAPRPSHSPRRSMASARSADRRPRLSALLARLSWRSVATGGAGRCTPLAVRAMPGTLMEGICSDPPASYAAQPWLFVRGAGWVLVEPPPAAYAAERLALYSPPQWEHRLRPAFPRPARKNWSYYGATARGGSGSRAYSMAA